MQPLNLFLRAFFASRLPAQCNPVSQHILLIPPSEFWLSHKDSETSASYSELLTSEDFLACHIIRVQPNAKDAPFSKDARTKAKQFTTINGRTIVVKDNFVYTNKGYRSLNQAQILNDALYHSDAIDSPQWLVYYINRPLVGTPEPLHATLIPQQNTTPAVIDGSAATGLLDKDSIPQKEIKTFRELLDHFPAINRYMTPALEKLFKDFATEMESVAIERATRESLSPTTSHSDTASVATTQSSKSNGKVLELSKYVSHESASEEMHLRRSLETLIYAAIDSFQSVDQNQLSMVGARTNLSGPIVERLIERYVAERFHDTVLFPRLCTMLNDEDRDLELSIKPMVDIDVSQVGITVESMQHRKQLSLRLSKGVEAFRKMNTAIGPQDMIDILLNTQKCLSTGSTDGKGTAGPGTAEKIDPILTMNADTLVSLMLVVVIRAPVANLQARLAYMRDFSFVADVDTGETGYALSTFEAVLEYLSSNSGVLRKASRANRALWQATRDGDYATVQSILEPEESHEDAIALTEEPESADENLDMEPASQLGAMVNGSGISGPPEGPATTGGLSHVFPFMLQHANDSSSQAEPFLPKLKKRVSLEARSMSSSSARSYLSGSSVLTSMVSHLVIETAPKHLAATEDSSGKSVLMMAIEHSRAEVLAYLLSLQEFFSIAAVLETANQAGTTLFMAAIQLQNSQVIHVMLDYLIDFVLDDNELANYFSRHDDQGRSVAHYLFNCPELIGRLGHLLPWQKRDKNGQTPLMAICRSYDHSAYTQMVVFAIEAAVAHQGDDEPLHLDQHVDNKGNTLLHVVNDPQISKLILLHCDVDVNARNDKQLTPLMTASRFGRAEVIRALFSDPRLDPLARDARGQTAAELAKDDDVRSRIDDALLLVHMHARAHSQTTAIVRAHLIEDANIRLILKSGSPNSNSTVTVTTCRRVAEDIQNLCRWLAVEHPASWMPSISPATTRSPFQIPNKPSKAVLRDLQARYDRQLRQLLAHSTFSSHETLWEFVLVPDIDMSMLAERTTLKASVRVERLREEYEPLPIASIPELELFMQHAHEQVDAVHIVLRDLFRRINNYRNANADISEALQILISQVVSAMSFLPKSHLEAFKRHGVQLKEPENSPNTQLHYSVSSLLLSTSAILQALDRPSHLIGTLYQLSEQLSRHMSSATRTQRLPSGFGLLDDFRVREQNESLNRADKTRSEIANLGRELRYTQTTVAAELAGWQADHPRVLRDDLKLFARRMVVCEKNRLDGMRRALRMVRDAREPKAYM